MKLLKGIKSLEDERYLFRYQRNDPASGKRVSRLKTFEGTANKANAAFIAFQKDVDKELEKKVPAATAETFNDYVQYWFEHPSFGGKRHGTKVHEKDCFNSMILPILGDVKLNKFDVAHLLYWQKQIQKRLSKHGRAYSRQSYIKAWRLIRTVIKCAGVEKKIEKGLCDGVRFSPSGAPPKERESLTPEEQIKLLKVVDEESLDIKAMIYLQLTTGCRFSEISATEWSDIDFSKSQLTISKSHVLQHVGETKTKKTRKCAIESYVLKILMEHQEKQQQIVGAVNPNLVFPSKLGSYRDPAMMYKVLGRCAKKAGIKKKFGSHALRRTFIDNERISGTDRAVIKASVGHETDKMFEHYSHITLEEKRQAVNKAFEGILPETEDGIVVH